MSLITTMFNTSKINKKVKNTEMTNNELLQSRFRCFVEI